MKRIFVWALILALLCGMALAEMEAAQDKPLPDPNAGEYRTQYDPKPNVALPGWGGIHMEADTVNVWMPFYNPEKNEGYYDLTFALWAALPEEAIAEGAETRIVAETDYETGEVQEVLYTKLFQSGLVPAGLFLQDVTLNQPVPEGEYRAYVRIQPYYVEDTTPTMSNGDVALVLNVTK